MLSALAPLTMLLSLLPGGPFLFYLYTPSALPLAPPPAASLLLALLLDFQLSALAATAAAAALFQPPLQPLLITQGLLFHLCAAPALVASHPFLAFALSFCALHALALQRPRLILCTWLLFFNLAAHTLLARLGLSLLR